MATNLPHRSIALVIEAEPDSAEKCCNLIESVEAVPVHASSLSKGLEAIRIAAPDVIIVGHELPDGTGLDCIGALRQSPEHRGTPIILLTNEIHAGELERAVMMGIYAFLAKPFQDEEFIKLMTAALIENANRANQHDG
jgi:CheY-like chemotaxis protein